MYYDLDKSCKNYESCIKRLGIYALFQTLACLENRYFTTNSRCQFCNLYSPRKENNDG